MDFGCAALLMASVAHGYFILTRYNTHYFSVRNGTIWTPNDFLFILFCVYSPAHALIWMLVTPTNLILVIVIMVIISKQVGPLKFVTYAHRLIMMT
jgi:hypothetical protein